MDFKWKKTAKKVVKLFLVYGAPLLLNELTVQYPQIMALSVGGALHALLDIAKHKYGLRVL